MNIRKAFTLLLLISFSTAQLDCMQSISESKRKISDQEIGFLQSSSALTLSDEFSFKNFCGVREGIAMSILLLSIPLKSAVIKNTFGRSYYKNVMKERIGECAQISLASIPFSPALWKPSVSNAKKAIGVAFISGIISLCSQEEIKASAFLEKIKKNGLTQISHLMFDSVYDRKVDWKMLLPTVAITSLCASQDDLELIGKKIGLCKEDSKFKGFSYLSDRLVKRLAPSDAVKIDRDLLLRLKKEAKSNQYRRSPFILRGMSLVHDLLLGKSISNIEFLLTVKQRLKNQISKGLGLPEELTEEIFSYCCAEPFSDERFSAYKQGEIVISDADLIKEILPHIKSSNWENLFRQWGGRSEFGIIAKIGDGSEKVDTKNFGI